ncbi:phage major capsid protein [Candidatus Pacearchaeota archaeon]|nr:phage major capsid protein [Candidatus Pacearchaeota archaeon]
MADQAVKVVELIEKVGVALDKFKGQDEAVKGLKDDMARLEEKLLVEHVTGDKRISSLLDDQWDSDKQAKQFVDFLINVTMDNTKELIPGSKAMNEGTDSAGGYLVPEEVQPVLVRLIEKYGLVRQLARKIPMNHQIMTMPSLTTGLTPYWPAEVASITESQPVFGQVSLTAKKMALLVPVSSELVADSNIAVANLIATLASEAIAKEEDAQGLTGTGSPMTGILSHGSVNTVTMGTGDVTYNTIDADDLMDMTSAVADAATDDAAFFMHRTVLDTIRKLRANQGGGAGTGDYIYDKPSAPTMPGTIWGYPVYTSDRMPGTATVDSQEDNTPFVIFGSLKHLYFGDRMQLTVDNSGHHGFANDLVYYRFRERIAMTVAIPAAFAVLKTSSV